MFGDFAHQQGGDLRASRKHDHQKGGQARRLLREAAQRDAQQDGEPHRYPQAGEEVAHGQPDKGRIGRAEPDTRQRQRGQRAQALDLLLHAPAAVHEGLPDAAGDHAGHEKTQRQARGLLVLAQRFGGEADEPEILAPFGQAAAQPGEQHPAHQRLAQQADVAQRRPPGGVRAGVVRVRMVGAELHAAQVLPLQRQQPQARGQQGEHQVRAAPARVQRQRCGREQGREHRAAAIAHVHQADDAGALLGVIAQLGQQPVAQGEQRGLEGGHRHHEEGQPAKAGRPEHPSHRQQHGRGVGAQQASRREALGDGAAQQRADRAARAPDRHQPAHLLERNAHLRPQVGRDRPQQRAEHTPGQGAVQDDPGDIGQAAQDLERGRQGGSDTVQVRLSIEECNRLSSGPPCRARVVL